MKKHWLILISLILLAPCVWAQSFKRTTKTPGFFIPKGALQTNNRPEKLVPVEAMRYQGQQAPIVVEMKQQAQEKAKKEAEEKARLEAEEKKKQEQEIREKQRQERLAKLQQEQQNILSTEEKREEITPLPSEDETENEIETSTPSGNKKLSPIEAARLRAEKIKTAQQKTETQTQPTTTEKLKTAPTRQPDTQKDEEMFARIIEEYRRDTKAISEGKPIKNQRLMDMIADYKDVERPI